MLLAGAMCASLAACGGTTTGGDTSGDTTGESGGEGYSIDVILKTTAS